MTALTTTAGPDRRGLACATRFASVPASLTEQWTSPVWRLEADSWIRTALAGLGAEPTGPIEQPRARFWSTQLTVESTAGRWWFKANNPDQAFEAGLVATMADLVPEHVAAPLRVDPGRGWMLTADQGPTLHAADRTDRETWGRVVGDFADLQRRLAGRTDALSGAGLPALPPTATPDHLEALLEEATARPDADPRHVPPDLAARARAVLPRIASAASRLVAGPVPLTLEHNDLHSNNAFVPPGPGQPLRYFDFGDSVLAHPFTSMSLPLDTACDDWNVERDSPDVRYLVDAYLEPWTDHGDRGDREDLRELLDLAVAFGGIHRLATWQRVLPYAGDDELAEFGPAVPGFLSRVVEVWEQPGH